MSFVAVAKMIGEMRAQNFLNDLRKRTEARMKLGPENIARQIRGGPLRDFATNEVRAWMDYEGMPLDIHVDGIKYVVFCRSHFERDNGMHIAGDYIRNHESHKERLRAKRAHETLIKKNYEAVDHPRHYNTHPSGVECIDVVEHMGFNLGNVVKYLWRMGSKPGVNDLEDLKKARWYLDREIRRIEK